MNNIDYQQKISQLAKLIKKSKRTLVLTGAGASTESGIPDFRSSKSGLWEKYNPQEVASIQALRRDPEKFYQLNLQWWDECMRAQPNKTHYALAQLEKMGFLLGVITQNIDGLHQKAGSERVWEVHGHLRNCQCFTCRRAYDMERLKENFYCDCGGLLRPSVVLFGDSMAWDYLAAEKAMAGCQLLLVVGSSMQVYPVAGLAYMARKVVIINHDATPWDKEATLVFRQSSGQVLTDVVQQLQSQ
jgi:NAD-dependent deacetylase